MLALLGLVILAWAFYWFMDWVVFAEMPEFWTFWLIFVGAVILVLVYMTAPMGDSVPLHTNEVFVGSNGQNQQQVLLSYQGVYLQADNTNSVINYNAKKRSSMTYWEKPIGWTKTVFWPLPGRQGVTVVNLLPTDKP